MYFNVIEINKNKNKIDPVIYIVNHNTSESKILDYFGLLTIEGKNKIVVTGGKTRWKIITNLYSNLDTIKLSKKTSGNLDLFIKKCKKEIDKGYNIIIFPEGKYSNKKKNWRKLENFQTGTFILSKQYNIPIVPVLISGDTHQYGFICNKDLKIQYLNTIYPDRFNNYENLRDYCMLYMNKKLKLL